jgi:hypothetical protein
MIIKNGTIEVITNSGGGIDETTGLNTESSVAYGQPIDCQFKANKFSFKGKSNGSNFTVAQYEIYIDCCDAFTGEKLRIKDAKGLTVGEFQIISFEPLDAVGQIRIYV